MCSILQSPELHKKQLRTVAICTLARQIIPPEKWFWLHGSLQSQGYKFPYLWSHSMPNAKAKLKPLWKSFNRSITWQWPLSNLKSIKEEIWETITMLVYHVVTVKCKQLLHTAVWQPYKRVENRPLQHTDLLLCRCESTCSKDTRIKPDICFIMGVAVAYDNFL